MATHNKTYIQDIVTEKKEQEDVEGESVPMELPERRLHIQQLSNASLIYDHLSYVDVLILPCHIQRQLPIVIPYIPITSLQQQFLHYSSIT